MSVSKTSRVLKAALAVAALSSTMLTVNAGSASASVGTSIVSIASANVGNGPTSLNSAGGYGYYTSANENWCADFAKWVWAQDGVDVTGLTSGAGSFANYGSRLHQSPQVGDAAVFDFNGVDWAAHVSIVTSVNSDGTVSTIGGNQGGGAGVVSAGLITSGGYYGSKHVSGYVSPIGGRDFASPVNVQLDIVGADGAQYSQFGNYAAGSFNPGWTNVGGASISKITSVNVGGDLVHFYAVAGGRVYGQDHIPSQNRWTGWAEIPGNASSVKDIAASANGNNVILSIIGGDGVLYTQYGNYDQGHFDANWTTRNGASLTSITTVTGNSNTIRIYAVGAGGHVYGEDFTLSSNSVGGWGEIPGGALGVKDIAGSMNGNNVVLSIVGADGVLYTQYGNYDQGHFDANWTTRNGASLTNITTVTGNSNTIHIYAVGAGGHVYGEDFILSTNSVGGWGEIPGGAVGAQDITASNSN